MHGYIISWVGSIGSSWVVCSRNTQFEMNIFSVQVCLVPDTSPALCLFGSPMDAQLHSIWSEYFLFSSVHGTMCPDACPMVVLFPLGCHFLKVKNRKKQARLISVYTMWAIHSYFGCDDLSNFRITAFSTKSQQSPKVTSPYIHKRGDNCIVVALSSQDVSDSISSLSNAFFKPIWIYKIKTFLSINCFKRRSETLESLQDQFDDHSSFTLTFWKIFCKGVPFRKLGSNSLGVL